MGFDDLWAILLVRSHATIGGISLSFGCTTLERACDNAARASAAFGFGCTLHQGAARPLLGPIETAERILGPGGMRGPALPNERAPLAGPAVDALAAWAMRGGGTVLALGPLTNLAILWLAHPAAASRIERIVWMGGGITAGNHTASAEFNAFADPEALSVLLERNAPLAMVDLDACRRVLVGREGIDAVRTGGGSNADLLAGLLEAYVDIARSRGRERMAVYDPVAAAVLLDPSLGQFEPARIDVERFGALTRGRTVVDRRAGAPPANAQFLAELDADAVRRLCLTALVGR